MRFLAVAVIVCVTISLLFIILFSKEIGTFVLNSFMELTGGKAKQGSTAPTAATTSAPIHTYEQTNTSTKNFVPPGFIGPTGPPSVKGPSGPPPNY
jgi:hypothetical protein